jgi:hypothetical protein
MNLESWYRTFGNLLRNISYNINCIFNSSNEGVVVWCQKNEDPFPFTSQKNDRAVKPDFILIRNFPTALRANDFKSILLGKFT